MSRLTAPPASVRATSPSLTRSVRPYGVVVSATGPFTCAHVWYIPVTKRICTHTSATIEKDGTIPASLTFRSGTASVDAHGSTTTASAKRPPIHMALAAVCAQSTARDNQTGGVAAGWPLSDVVTISTAASAITTRSHRTRGV